MTRLEQFVTDLIYPNRCPCCDRFISYDTYVCDDCLNAMIDPSDTLCLYCGFDLQHCKCGNGIYYDRAFTCYAYEGYAKKGILSLKASKNLNFAKHVGNILSDQIQKTIIRYDEIVPVPMNVRKRIKRGYNQAEIIARVMSKKLGVPLDTNALGVHYSKTVQHSLNRTARIKHAGEIYFEGISNVKDKYIILVDDIMTTGNTLNVCSNLLHGMGAKSVIAAVATTTILKDHD